MARKLVVGLTGGIGAGKSRVGRYLARLHSWPRIDVDDLCRQLVEPGQEGLTALRAGFGDRFVDDRGRLDRPALRQALFADPELRARVEAVLHPLARTALRRELDRLARGVAVVEVPLLFEAGWQGEVDRVVTVWARPRIQRQRLAARDSLNGDQCCQAIAAQMDPQAKARAADHVIDNSGPWADTCLQIRHLARFFLAQLQVGDGKNP